MGLCRTQHPTQPPMATPAPAAILRAPAATRGPAEPVRVPIALTPEGERAAQARVQAELLALPIGELEARLEVSERWIAEHPGLIGASAARLSRADLMRRREHVEGWRMVRAVARHRGLTVTESTKTGPGHGRPGPVRER